MFGWFKRKKPHPLRRELAGLLSCVTAWRRAVLEMRFLERGDQDAISRDLENLTWYVHGAAEMVDPFATSLVRHPLGQLEPSALVDALYRIETASSIAWSLGLTSTIPNIDDRADRDSLDELFPLDAPASSVTTGARLHDASVIEAQLAAWMSRLATAKDECHMLPSDEAAGIRYSRAYERTRGLLWVTSNAAYVHEATVP